MGRVEGQLEFRFLKGPCFAGDRSDSSPSATISENSISPLAGQVAPQPLTNGQASFSSTLKGDAEAGE